MNDELKKELKQIARQLEEQAAQNLTLANKLNKAITRSCQRP